jgi:hypothetical protein
MAAPKRIAALERLVSDMIGDGKAPNLFFVTHGGNVILIARDFEVAYPVWQSISHQRTAETSLEDRQTGVLASVEPESDKPGARLRLLDDTHDVRRRR